MADIIKMDYPTMDQASATYMKAVGTAEEMASEVE